MMGMCRPTSGTRTLEDLRSEIGEKSRDFVNFMTLIYWDYFPRNLEVLTFQIPIIRSASNSLKNLL